MKTAIFAAFVSIFAATPALAANLLVNGNFEASSRNDTTPPGWTNIGHVEGVINYSIGPVPAYDGAYFYDLGGYGDNTGPVGDGIAQTIATVAGRKYTVTFGLSSENVSGTSRLDVSVGSLLTSFSSDADGRYFQRPFATRSFGYVATGPSTTIRLVEGLNTSFGRNDPLIDAVSFSSAAIPEPASWALMMAGFGMLGATLRARRAAGAA